MVFGQLRGSSLEDIEKLHNDIFCLRQERDFFLQKSTDQASGLQDQKDELKLAWKEIDKLRSELIRISVQKDNDSKPMLEVSAILEAPGKEYGDAEPREVLSELDAYTTGSKDENVLQEASDKDQFQQEDLKDDDDDQSSTKSDCPDVENDVKETEVENGDQETDDIRDHAARMLIWANYQCSKKQGCPSVTASPSGSTHPDQESTFSASTQSNLTPAFRFQHSGSVPLTVHAQQAQKKGPISKMIKDFLDPQFDCESDLDSDSESEDESEDECEPKQRIGPLARLERIVTQI